MKHLNHFSFLTMRRLLIRLRTIVMVLVSEEEAAELRETDKKEFLKLHRFFAHRSGQKLWKNLFYPGGRLKGKKKLILEVLENCKK